MSAEPQPGLVKLTGIIANYTVTRAEASFVFTDSDRNAMGVIAIAAAVAGLSGPAIATAANASATEDDADYVEFDLDGTAVKGWVWRSPFKEGDQVEVAAEWRGDHYEAAGIARPEDRTIALYPHCSRGRSKQIRNSIKMWLLGVTGLLAFAGSAFTVMTTAKGIGGEAFAMICFVAYGFLMPLMWLLFGMRFVVPMVVLILTIGSSRLDWSGDFAEHLQPASWALIGIFIFFGLMTFSLTRKWMPFVRLAEKVFTTLGWPRPGNVDLVKSTKAQRKPGDPGELGTFYFRY